MKYKKIKYDVNISDYPESPREYEDQTKICIMEHRRYEFPNELDFDFVNFLYADTIEYDKIKKEYFVFKLDMYEHGAVRISLA
jgi:hypothetical protein